MFWTLVLFVVSFVASALLAPKPKLENARAGNLNDLDFPQSDEGAGVTFVFGKVKLTGPNTLWKGAFRAVPIKKKVKTGIFTSKKVITGYKYYLGLDLCLGMGELTLHEIQDDGETLLWQGAQSTEGTLQVFARPRDDSADELGSFSGSNNDQESPGKPKIRGSVHYYPGTLTHEPDPYILSKIAEEKRALLPAYRGFARCVFKDFYWGEQPQLTPLTFIVSNYPDVLGLGDKNKIGDDVNPASVLYYLLFSDWGGAGIRSSRIEKDSFIALGELLYEENHGISFVLGQTDQAKSYFDEVLRQIDAVILEDATTRLISVKAIRADYDLEEIPSFGDDDLLELVSYSRGFWETTQNEVRVSFTNQLRAYKTSTAIAQDMSAIGRAGAVRSSEFSFPGCSNGVLAQSLAQRELTQLTTPLIKTRLVLTRKASRLAPGDVFKWSNSEYGIKDLVLRVERADRGTLEDGRIALDLIQDVFGVGKIIFEPPAGGYGEEDPQFAEVPSIRHSVLAPRFLVQRLVADGLVKNGSDAVLLYMIGSPSPAHINFSAQLDGELVTTGIDFSPGAGLARDIDFYQTTFQVRSPAWVPTTENLKAGGGSILVGGTEWMQITQVQDDGDAFYTLTVLRSRFQTARRSHEANAPVLALSVENPPLDYEAVPVGDHQVKILTQTSRDNLRPDKAPEDTITVSPRAERELPSAPSFKTADSDAPADGMLTVEWKLRQAAGQVNVAVPSDPSQEVQADYYVTLSLKDTAQNVVRTYDQPTGAERGEIDLTGITPGTYHLEAKGALSPSRQSIETDALVVTIQ